MIGWVLLAALAPPDRAETVEQLLFETCPKVIAGEIRLDDEKHLGTLGFSPVKIGSDWVGGMRGEDQQALRLAFKRFEDKRACDVAFGGPDNEVVSGQILAAAKKRGWESKSGAKELGFVSFLEPREPNGTSIMVLRWPEFLGLKPATSMSLIVEDK